MLFKSKIFWICAVFTVCAAIFFSVVLHRTNQPKEPIKVYKYVKPAPHKTSQSSVDDAVSVQVADETATKVDTTDKTVVDFSNSKTDTTNTDTLTDTSDYLLTDKPNLMGVGASTSNLETDAAALAETEYIAQQIEELQIKIPQALQTRIQLMHQIAELSESHVSDEGPSPLIVQLYDETYELVKIISAMSSEYITIAKDDSVFRPGGEFYDLLEQNGMMVGVIQPSE